MVRCNVFGTGLYVFLGQSSNFGIPDISECINSIYEAETMDGSYKRLVMNMAARACKYFDKIGEMFSVTVGFIPADKNKRAELISAAYECHTISRDDETATVCFRCTSRSENAHIEETLRGLQKRIESGEENNA